MSVHAFHRRPLTPERLQALFHYDPETGIFTRIAADRSNGNAGCGKWVARITRHGADESLGVFSTKEEAIAVRRAAESRVFGDFAPRSEA